MNSYLRREGGGMSYPRYTRQTSAIHVLSTRPKFTENYIGKCENLNRNELNIFQLPGHECCFMRIMIHMFSINI